ncbi:FUSC family protein [Arthrobacter sp. Sa2BUA2]|uniref:FUSC family protein n=1 Tax=Arthrobacter pullicola TaxID=2762224 RepID=A0ABR8YIU3_9MICC|nr:FUSC family protein [Arthrobacter pullicola]MBD8044151.1 FUSC family protein [Arthrobacter pullicola]
MMIFSRPQPGTLPTTFKLLVAILIPSAIVSVLGGASASMGFGLAVGLGMAVTPVSRPRQAAMLVALGAALGGLASLAGSSPWAISVLIFVSAILNAISNQRSAGLLSLAPIMVILIGPGPIDLSWWSAVLWILAGGATGALITRLLKFQAPVLPVDKRTAWEHGLAVGLVCAAVMFWSLANDIPHGYWIAVTVLMALRPLPDQRRETLNGRLIGTFLGAVVALLAVVFLPSWGALIVAVLCLFFLVWYSMGGAYLMQALALTPMLLIFASLGDIERGFELTVERVIFTAIGFAVAVLAALLLRHWESRREAEMG